MQANILKNEQFAPVTFWNPFGQLEQKKPGDCVSLACLAATAMRLLGFDARVAKAYPVMAGTVSEDGKTWGWHQKMTNKFHSDWWLGFPGNRYEGFFYIGDANPPKTGNYPTKAWVVVPTTTDQNGKEIPFPPCQMTPGKDQSYIALKLFADIAVSQLRWQHKDLIDRPDLDWGATGAMSGVTEFITPCDTWSADPVDDIELDLVYDPVQKTLKLGNGAAQPISGDDTYSLPSASPAGKIRVVVDFDKLPASDSPVEDRTKKVQIAPARTRADVP